MAREPKHLCSDIPEVLLFVVFFFNLLSDGTRLAVIAGIAVACGHFAAALQLCVEPGEDPDKRAFSQ